MTEVHITQGKNKYTVERSGDINSVYSLLINALTDVIEEASASGVSMRELKARTNDDISYVLRQKGADR